MKIALPAAAALVAIALIPSSAAASSGSCFSSDQGASGHFSSAFGETNALVLASSSDGKLFGVQTDGTDRHGGSLAGGFECGNEQENRFRSYAVYLGNEDDTVRADAKGFDIVPDFGPVVRSVDLILRGGPGDDKLIAHDGSDTLRGGSGDDVIRDTGGEDVIGGGSGDDVIEARDGDRDVIDCGGGDDTVKADPIDSVRNC